jgi:ABC-type branched-subunit amino acid transport system substrate-binding protein
LLRSCLVRYAAPFATLAAAALEACVPPTVPAPLAVPPLPYATPSPMPPPPATARTGPVKIGLLLPLSGPNAELGKAMLDAAELALFEKGGDRLTLVPRDTKGTAGAAADAARSAIADGVGIILGPLLAAEVEAVKPIAADGHLNVIAFSTVTRLAGGNTFLMGFLPKEEVVREVGFARDRGLARFAALAPNSPYGHVAVDALRDAAAATGASLTDAEFYDPGEGDATAAIAHLLPAASPAAGAGIAAGTAAPEPRPAPRFDALLLPEGGQRLRRIAQEIRLAELDTKAVRLLGSGLWDEPGIGSERALDGGWFAASPPAPRQDFERRYRATYGRDPPRLASLGYDAAALAATLAQGPEERPFSRQAILDPQGFAGIDGRFRFTPYGLIQRALAVLEIAPSGNVVVSPAPESFQNLGY